MAVVDAVPCCHRTNGAELSDTKILSIEIPESVSVPFQATGNEAAFCVTLKAVTALRGAVLSMELHQAGVLSAAFASNTTAA